MRPTGPFVVALGVALLAGCGDGSARSTPEIVVDTLDGGVIRVSSPTVGQWSEGEGWMLEEELRIGASSGDGPDLFGNISSIDVDDQGRILVLDTQAAELRIFGPDGTHIRTLGGRGGGPGEFQNPVGLALAPDGAIWVVDPGNGRYTAFDPDGTLIATHPRPIGFFAWPWPTGFDRDGRLYDIAPGAIIRLSNEMTLADTIRLPEYAAEQVAVQAGDGNMIMTMIPPFSPRMHWQFDPRGYVWSAVSDRFHFVQQTFAGDTVRIVRREHDPVPVTRAEADSVIEGMQSAIARNAGADARVDGDLRAPPHKPAFQGFLVDDSGGLWVEPSRASGDDRAFHVFHPEGAFLGTVEVDRGFQTSSVTPVFREGLVYAVVTDELDVPHVVRYRIAGLADRQDPPGSADRVSPWLLKSTGRQAVGLERRLQTAPQAAAHQTRATASRMRRVRFRVGSVWT